MSEKHYCLGSPARTIQRRTWAKFIIMLLWKNGHWKKKTKTLESVNKDKSMQSKNKVMSYHEEFFFTLFLFFLIWHVFLEFPLTCLYSILVWLHPCGAWGGLGWFPGSVRSCQCNHEHMASFHLHLTEPFRGQMYSLGAASLKWGVTTLPVKLYQNQGTLKPYVNQPWPQFIFIH